MADKDAQRGYGLAKAIDQRCGAPEVGARSCDWAVPAFGKRVTMAYGVD